MDSTPAGWISYGMEAEIMATGIVVDGEYAEDNTPQQTITTAPPPAEDVAAQQEGPTHE